MSVKHENETDWSNELIIQLDIPVESIHIKSFDLATGREQTDESDSIEPSSKFEWLQPETNLRSQWLIELKAFKNCHKLLFKPLDIQGVCFDIKIPTAISHIELD